MVVHEEVVHLVQEYDQFLFADTQLVHSIPEYSLRSETS